ncbi:hypothetical protein PVK06_043352 [Gossypium arboreum]|uniref:Uncharacterized protein n=1 Tax=Gossypium arboreum TaxID=29729 RepID=A0ABR0MNQ3_GOSAR|nr:hypothetical protein PVK06_043352 [Gossypium arboreum]
MKRETIVITDITAVAIHLQRSAIAPRRVVSYPGRIHVDCVKLSRLCVLAMADFHRFNSPFYEAPRFVTHIDDASSVAVTKYCLGVFPRSNTLEVSILDMCSSWVSHLQSGYKQEQIVGMRMNDEEIKRNPEYNNYSHFFNGWIISWSSLSYKQN